MFEPGSQIGRYEIQRRLGRGGMGTVYVAHDPVLGRMVAIKVFAGDLDVERAGERFTREARAAAALGHPNIVTVHDFGEHDAQAFIVMEYVPGETLAGIIRRRAPVSLADKLRWVEEVCAGASYAHSMRVVHRDIKPANLIVDRSGHLKILDFGVARMAGITSSTSLMVGTPGYMAPEQITGEPVDHRADQFSIGVVCYELLSFTEPFTGDTLPMITNRILSEEPVPLERLVPDLSPELVQIVARAMRKKAADRFPDVEALRAAIARERRQNAPDDEWNAPTIVTGRYTPSAGSGSGSGSGSRGTGSARRWQDGGVGVAQATPPPDPRRTGREELAQRRTLQLEAALNEARRLLALGDLDAALEQCYQALTLDERHAAALELEAEISGAIRGRNEEGTRVTPVAEGRTPTVTVPSNRVSAVGPGTPPAGPDRAGLEGRSGLQATAVAVPAVAAATVTAPGWWQRARAAVEVAVVARVRRDPRRAALVGGIVVVLGVAALVMSLPAATGRAVIDAAPWGTITAIESVDGDARPLPASAATPLRLSLPVGTYEVTVTSPPPESREERVRVTVEADGEVFAPLVRFPPLTPEDYFEPYLTQSAGGAPGGVAPAAAPAAVGGAGEGQ